MGIDTSCDDTSCAIVEDGRQILSNVVSSQITEHSEYGGVVPEIACRKHVENIVGVVRKAIADAKCELNDISAIAVTKGPGLVGALLVGIGVAKAIAYSQSLPLIPVNHLEGHILSPFLASGVNYEFPFVSLVVSGGHTSLYVVRELGRYEAVGRTVDDAAGEAFDKTAKALGLGYPGGPVVEKRAAKAARSIELPSPMIKHDSFDFSFSGLKTAALNYIRFELEIEPNANCGDAIDTDAVDSLCAGFQDAVIDVLLYKAFRLSEQRKIPIVALGGGVSANTTLRERFISRGKQDAVRVIFPSKPLSTDNAAMIAAAGFHRFVNKEFADSTLDAEPNLPL
ncbi:MAG: tRNA (adenosine(37)-N6)-threonylcarbamoyltransferase complex transferase subunit TsaD [Candidatus Coatesbacteria bacterium]|nr:tRNA (adenosine(37)-N6)-threonylcarbamoyltransferase complex transferase subunit TsaD [Candidatus Coatesbacteria bacterium]